VRHEARSKRKARDDGLPKPFSQARQEAHNEKSAHIALTSAVRFAVQTSDEVLVSNVQQRDKESVLRSVKDLLAPRYKRREISREVFKLVAKEATAEALAEVDSNMDSNTFGAPHGDAAALARIVQRHVQRALAEETVQPR